MNRKLLFLLYGLFAVVIAFSVTFGYLALRPYLSNVISSLSRDLSNYWTNLTTPKPTYTFKSAPKQSGFSLLNENKKAGFKVLLGRSDAPKIPEARFEVADSWIDFSLGTNVGESEFKKLSSVLSSQFSDTSQPDNRSTGQQETENRKQKTDNRDLITWENVLPSVDIQYQMKDDGLKEDIILKDKSLAQKAVDNHELFTLPFYLTTYNVVPRYDLNGKLVPIFIDSQTGEYRFHMETPYLVDAKGARYESVEFELTPLDLSLSPDKGVILSEVEGSPLDVALDSEASRQTGFAQNVKPGLEESEAHQKTASLEAASLGIGDATSPEPENYRNSSILETGLSTGNTIEDHLSKESNIGQKQNNQGQPKGNSGSSIDIQKNIIDIPFGHTNFLSVNAIINATIAKIKSAVNTNRLAFLRDLPIVGEIINITPNQPADKLTNRSERTDQKDGSNLNINNTVTNTPNFVNSVYAAENQSSVLSSQLSDPSQSVAQLTGQQTTDKPETENRQPKTDNRIGSRYLLVLKLPRDWLADPDRAYPVIIDPTITHNTQTAFATGTLNRVKDEGAADAAPLLTSSYHELPADIRTVGLWHMNENTGTTISDASGNGNTGTFAASTQAPSWTSSSRLGASAVSFDGTASGDYLTVPYNSAFNGDHDLTIEYWAYPADETENRYDLYKNMSVDGSGEWFVGIDNGTAQISMYSTVPTAYTASCTGSFANRWVHIAATHNHSNEKITLYVDGIECASAIFSGTHRTGAYSLAIGGLSFTGYAENYYSNKKIDEVRISNVARTPEEIKANAQRFPYSVYTSPVVDLTQAISWTNLTWLGKGIRTGDGETTISTTNLVAQWNFNATTSTTTATNDAGSCGAACNGTLTNFASTASQDQAAGTGWTSANKRWGAGALMLDGTNDYVDAGTNSALNFTTQDFTIEAWIKINDAISGSANYAILTKDNISTAGYVFRINGNTGGGSINFLTSQSAAFQQTNSAATEIQSGNWYHVAVTRSGSSARVYKNGIDVTSSAGSHINPTSTSQAALIGMRSSTDWFKGVIDSTRIYNRTLTAAEILANYQAGNIEFQTRTSADNATWEAWKPVTGETAIDSMDSLTPTAGLTGGNQITTATLANSRAFWNLNESTATSATDGSGNGNTLTNTGTTVVSGKTAQFGNARSFNGTSDFLSCTDAACGGSTKLEPTGDISIGAWIKTSQTSMGYIVGKGGGGDGLYYYELVINEATANKVGFRNYTTGNGNYIYIQSNTSINDNNWHYIVGTISGTTGRLYVDGVLENTVVGSGTRQTDVTGAVEIGRRVTGYYSGLIDDAFVTATALTANQIQQLYFGNPKSIATTSDTATKIEGAGSEKLTLGAPQVDANTVGLWHMDETSGTGAYIKDSASTNHGTPTGTSVVDGFYGKARSFNGTSDYVDVPDVSSLDVTGALTLSAWVYPKVSSVGGTVIGKYVSPNNSYFLAASSGAIYLGVSSTGSNWTLLTGNTSMSANQWHHIVGVYIPSTSLTVYLDGQLDGTNTTSIPASIYSGAASVNIGRRGPADSYFNNGNIDEVKIDNTARTAEEIAEAYRAGRDHRVTRGFASTDLSGKSKLPFYIASDRPGTFMEATVGESAYANYEPDANTVGLWHLEEQTGSGAYIKDSSGSGNNGTPTGTTFVQGKIGKARSFNGSSNFILLPASSAFDLQAFSIEAWVYPNAFPASYFIFEKTTNGSVNTQYSCFFNNDVNNSLYFRTFNNSGVQDDLTVTQANLGVNANSWSHMACVYDGSGKYIYANGKQVAYKAYSQTLMTNPAGTAIIGAYGTGQGYFFNGYIDEMRISKVGRTADDIRQAYEIGKRTHPITIDFVSSPQAAYSSGTSVTINNPSGTTALTNTLSVGDTIIFKENVNGTETVSQATVNTIANTTSTYGTVTLASAPTFPTGGYSTNAKVFKWQREYFDLTGSLATHRDAITRLTMRVTDGSQGANVWLDDFRSNTNYLADNTPDSYDTATGIGTYSVSGASITSTLNRYFQYRAIIGGWDTPVSPQLTSASLNWVSNSTPAAPAISAPTNGATQVSFTPAISMSATDADSDYLRYKVDIATDGAFSQNLQTFTQPSGSPQTGWSGQNAQTSTAYTSGSTATYTIQSALSAATTYYIRSYAVDPAGSNVWSSASSTISFTTNTAPNAPTISAPANAAANVSLTPAISLAATDGAGDYVRYQIQIATDTGFTANLQTFTQPSGSPQTGWTGQNTQTSTAYTSGTTGTYTISTALSQNVIYYIRAYAVDPAGANLWSPAATTTSFTTTGIPGAPTAVSPLNNVFRVLDPYTDKSKIDSSTSIYFTPEDKAILQLQY